MSRNQKVMLQPWTYKRFVTNAIESYVGALNEPILDCRAQEPVLRICDGVTPGCTIVTAEMFGAVAIPEIISPLNTATSVNRQVQLTGSEFLGVTSDGQIDDHESSQWRIYSDVGLTTPVYDSGLDTANLTEYDLMLEGVTLDANTQFWATVTYVGASGNTATAPAITFTTALAGPTTETAALFGDITNVGAGNGWAVKISGDGSTIVSAAPLADDVSGGSDEAGAVFIYREISGTFQRIHTLKASHGVGVDANDYFGYSVDISSDGNTLVVAHPSDDLLTSNAGRVSIYSLASGTFGNLITDFTINANVGLPGQITLVNTNNGFGSAVAISGDGLVMVATAPSHIWFNSGDFPAWAGNSDLPIVFEKAAGTWTPIALLDRPAGITGAEGFGLSVDISDNGDVIVLGTLAPHGAPENTLKGRVDIYERAGNAWPRSNGGLADWTAASTTTLGFAVAVSGDGSRVVAGAPALLSSPALQPNGNTPNVQVFAKVAGSWDVVDIILGDTGNAFGYAVALSSNGNVLMVGDITDKLIYQYNWVSTEYVLGSTFGPADAPSTAAFGGSVSLTTDGSEMVVGDYLNNTLASAAGKAYYFA